MKRITIIISFLVLNSVFGLAQKAEFSFLEKPVIKWDKTPEGQILSHYFVFENSGSEPLVISEAKVTCPCTKVEFPEYPISPNKTDSILVTFDTNKKAYFQDRTVQILSNAKKNPTLKLKVYVIPKEE